MIIAEIDRSHVIAFTQGDERCFREIYNLIHPAIFLFATRLLGEPELAKDIASETLMKVWNRRTQMQTMDYIRKFAYNVTRNACLDELDKRRRQAAIRGGIAYLSDEAGEHVLDKMMNIEVVTEVWRQVEQLPPQFKTVCHLLFVEGRTSAEVAAALGITAKTVRNYKSRAVELIRQRLNQHRLLTPVLCLVLQAWLTDKG